MCKRSERSWDYKNGNRKLSPESLKDGNSRWHHEVLRSEIDVLALSRWRGDWHRNAGSVAAFRRLCRLPAGICFAPSNPAIAYQSRAQKSAGRSVAEIASGDFTRGGASAASVLPRSADSDRERDSGIHGSGNCRI